MSSICAIFRINDGKAGYLAVVGENNYPKCLNLQQLIGVCNNLGVKTLKAFKYYGNDFGDGFDFVDSKLSLFKSKMVRTRKEFSKYIKLFNPRLSVNPIEYNGVVFDQPYLQLNNNILCYWEPAFEKSIDKNNLKIDSTGAIVEYSYKQPIFILLHDAKRHIPKVNSETVLINRLTGVVTRKLTIATADTYSELVFTLKGSSLVCVSNDSFPIAGYKLRS